MATPVSQGSSSQPPQTSGEPINKAQPNSSKAPKSITTASPAKKKKIHSNPELAPESSQKPHIMHKGKHTKAPKEEPTTGPKSDLAQPIMETTTTTTTTTSAPSQSVPAAEVATGAPRSDLETSAEV